MAARANDPPPSPAMSSSSHSGPPPPQSNSKLSPAFQALLAEGRELGPGPGPLVAAPRQSAFYRVLQVGGWKGGGAGMCA